MIFLRCSVTNRSKNCGKSTKNGFVHKNRQRLHVRIAFLSQNVDFLSIFGIPLGSRGPPGTSGSLPEAFMFVYKFPIASENRPKPAPGRPRVSPRHLLGTVLGRFWIHFSDRFASPGMDLASIFLDIAMIPRDTTRYEKTYGNIAESLGGCLEIAGDCDAVCPLMLVLSACASHVMGKT